MQWYFYFGWELVKMKVRKTVDMDRDSINITKMFERKLLETCIVGSIVYDNNMREFEKMLQEVADKAFKLGQENAK